MAGAATLAVSERTRSDAVVVRPVSDPPLPLDVLVQTVQRGRSPDSGVWSVRYLLSRKEVERLNVLRNSMPRSSRDLRLARDRRRDGLTYEMVQARVSELVTAAPSTDSLRQQLEGRRKIDARVLDAVLSVLGSSWREFFAPRGSLPFFLDDLVVSIDLAHRHHPAETTAIVERFTRLLDVWRREQYTNPELAVSLLSRLPSLLSRAEDMLLRAAQDMRRP